MDTGILLAHVRLFLSSGTNSTVSTRSREDPRLYSREHRPARPRLAPNRTPTPPRPARFGRPCASRPNAIATATRPPDAVYSFPFAR